MSPRCRAAPAGAALLLLLVLPTAAAGATAGEPPRPGPEILDRRAADGEQCVVCRVRVHEGDIVEVRYKGRRFFVAAAMLERLEAEPDRYSHLLEAHGGLFDEAAVEVPPLETRWLLAGLYVLVGLVAGAGCAWLALRRGLSGWSWFFAGLVANLAALAAVLAVGHRTGAPVAPAPGTTKIAATHPPVSCDRCGAGNHPAAPACSACGRALRPTIEPETARA